MAQKPFEYKAMVCTEVPLAPIVGAVCYITQDVPTGEFYSVHGRDPNSPQDWSDQQGWFQLSGSVFEGGVGQPTPPVVLHIDTDNFGNHQYNPMLPENSTYFLTKTSGTGSSSSPIVAAVEERHYDAVWRPGSSAEVQYYGLTRADLQKHYDDLWKKNYRIYLLNTYEENGQRLYDAVWRPGSSAEVQYYALTRADLQKHYDDLWKKNYRTYLLNTHEKNGHRLYHAL